jgi:murein DD-endopeptidase MepM/ murein hydrolase activator NlpD
MVAAALRLGVVAALIGLAGCGADKAIRDLFHSDSPYQAYVRRLQEAGLDQLALGRDWIDAGTRALSRPIEARLPFRETGYFAPERPEAVAYRLELTRGRTLSIAIDFQAASPARIFVDLFEPRDTNPPDRLASLEDGDSVLTWQVRRTGVYLLRLQPELLRGGRWTVVERTLASVGFPVPGVGVPAIKSRFGVERDAGRRRHHGIDIFAPRGTPAVAVTEGVARASTNPLGGNVVWLHDTRQGRTYYYAHFDRWAVGEHQPVKPGDTLGFIGNTGNARTTPPHLHFGIYESGPVDPFPFVAPDDPVPGSPAASAERLDDWVRVTVPTAVLLSGAHRGADTLRRLERGTIARVAGSANRLYRIELPDRETGYVAIEAVDAAAEPLRLLALDSGAVLRESPTAGAPVVAVLLDAAEAGLLGDFAGYVRVRLPSGREAWLVAPAVPPPSRRGRRPG